MLNDAPVKPKLLLVVAAFYPDSYGGAERQASILADALGRLGVDVTIIAPSIDRETPILEQTSFGQIARIHVSHYPNYGGKRILSFLRWTYEYNRRFCRSSFRGTPVYVFHARLHAFAPALAATILRSPLYIKLGGGGISLDFLALDDKRYFYGRWVKKFLLNRTLGFVANSREIEQDLSALGIPDNRIFKFPNGVAIPERTLVDEALSKRAGMRFIYVGRLVSDKNIWMLLEAALSLTRTNPSFRMTFLGDGAELTRMKAAVEQQDAMHAITFEGYSDDVYAHLLDSDFFVSASLREGQSNAVLEALAAAAIPIVFPASGVRDIIYPGTSGFIVSESTVKGLIDTMQNAMAMTVLERQHMATQGRHFIEGNFSIDLIAQRTLSHFKFS